MSYSSRFTVAVHALGLLALFRDKPLTSEFVAESVNTNPVVIRRILGVLCKAGLVETHPGAGGGSTLARRPESITLLEVYRVMGEGKIFPLHHHAPSNECPCGRHIQTVLAGVFDTAQAAMEKVLSAVTVSRIAGDIKVLEEEEEEEECAPC